VVLTGSVDADDLGHDEAATAAERAGRGPDRRDEAFFDRGPGYARLAGGAPYAEVDRR
jgi:N-methylhydantoinase B